MKFSLVLLPAFTALAAAAPAVRSSLNQRQIPSIESLITGLAAQVQQFTANMSQIVEALPSDASAVEQDLAATSISQVLDEVTGAFQDVNTQLAAAANQQSLGDLPSDVLGQLDGQPIALANLTIPIFQDLDPALQSVMTTVDLGQVYNSLQPLLDTELPGFISALEPLVSGFTDAIQPFLSNVGSLLSPILAGLNL